MVEDDLAARIERLEAEVAELRALLDRLAFVPPETSSRPPVATEPVHRLTVAPDVAPAAPVGQPEPQYTFLTAPHQAFMGTGKSHVEAAKAQEDPVTKDATDVEFKIGGRYMTIAGSVVVVLGILYLVALAISNRWITPQMQFGGELALCLAFVGIGLWKIEERENFGQMLVGVGASGLYLSFAGAYAAKHIITSQAMVVSFVAVSLGCLALSFWRTNKAFFCMGLLGGFLSVLLPLRENDFVAAQTLHPILLVPCAAIVWRFRWTLLAYALFIVSWIASIPPLDAAARSGAGHWPVLLPYYVFGLVSTVCYAFGRRASKEEPVPYMAYLAPFVLALTPFAIVEGLATPVGYIATVLYAATFGVIARFFGDEPTRKGLVTGAVVTGALVAPFALTPVQATAVFAMESAVAAAFLWRTASVPLYRLTVSLCLAGGAGSLMTLTNVKVGPTFELYVNALGVVSLGADAASAVLLAIAAAIAAARTPESTSSAESRAVLALLAATLLGRAPLLVGLDAGIGVFASLEIGALAALWASVVAILARRTLVPCFAAAAAQTAFLLFSAGLTSSPVTSKPMQFLFMALSLGGLGAFLAGYGRVKQAGLSGVSILVSLGGTVPFSWATHIVLTSLGFDPLTAMVASMALYSAIVAWVAKYRGWTDLAWTSVTYACLAVVPYIALLDSKSTEWKQWTRFGDVAATVVMMLATAASGAALAKTLKERSGLIAAVAAVPFGIFVCRLGYLGLCGPGIGVQNVLAVLMTATGYSCVLAAWSLARGYREVAWASFGFLAFALALYPAMKLPDAGFVIPPTHLVSRAADMASIATLFAATLIVGRALWKGDVSRDIVFNLLVPVDWALTAGFLMLALTAPPFVLKFDSSMSLAWIVYGAALISIGFWKAVQHLRYWGLAVFATTLVKVFFYDLAFLEVNVKVVVLIGFGIVMLTASHAYIRARKRQKLSP